jgi:SAM-dependent methyltransferase
MTREQKVSAQYAAAAEAWSQEAYADPASYLRHRADLVRTLGPGLQPGDTVLDLACGDGGMAEFLLPHGLRYLGVDASEEMVAAARKRLGDRADVALADLNEYEPPERVAATTCFRALYYAHDRLAFFRHVAGYTERKLVFDLNPRQYEPARIRAELAAAGFARIDLRPFFAPQTRALREPLAAMLRGAERTGPFARLVLRARFSYLVSAAPA